MNKTIDFDLLAGIIQRLDLTWYEQDQDHVNGRTIANYERAITNRLKKLGAGEQMTRDIYETHCVLDKTYKEQCDRLRARGYVIVNNG